MDEKRFRLPKIERPGNLLTPQGVKALVIVLAVILLISAIVYLNITRQKRESPSVLPATTEEEVTVEPEPTEVPTVVPTEEPTPVSEETPVSPAARPTATVSPTATESAPID